MATWVPLVVAAAERAQLPHVACSEWSLATHVRDSAPESSKHSSFRSELDSSALLLSSARCCGMVQHHESTPCLANALSVMYEEQVSAFAAANMSQARTHARLHFATTPHPNVLRRAAQYTTLFVADVLGVAHAPRRLARAGVVVEAVPESNALVSADIAEVASAELVHVLFATSTVCARASGTPEAKLACFYEGGSLPGQSPPSPGGPGPDAAMRPL